jgi:hypothetical protein
MLLIFDVEVIKDLLFLGLGDVRMRGFVVEFLLPDLNFRVFLLDKFNQVLVFINEMSVLSKQ